MRREDLEIHAHEGRLIISGVRRERVGPCEQYHRDRARPRQLHPHLPAADPDRRRSDYRRPPRRRAHRDVSEGRRRHPAHSRLMTVIRRAALVHAPRRRGVRRQPGRSPAGCGTPTMPAPRIRLRRPPRSRPPARPPPARRRVLVDFTRIAERTVPAVVNISAQQVISRSVPTIRWPSSSADAAASSRSAASPTPRLRRDHQQRRLHPDEQSRGRRRIRATGCHHRASRRHDHPRRTSASCAPSSSGSIRRPTWRC